MDLTDTAVPVSSSDKLFRAITDEIAKQTREIIDEEAKKAADTVQVRVREMAGKIAARVASHIDYAHRENNLIITVRFPEEKKTA